MRATISPTSVQVRALPLLTSLAGCPPPISIVPSVVEKICWPSSAVVSSVVGTEVCVASSISGVPVAEVLVFDEVFKSVETVIPLLVFEDGKPPELPVFVVFVGL